MLNFRVVVLLFSCLLFAGCADDALSPVDSDSKVARQVDMDSSVLGGDECDPPYIYCYEKPSEPLSVSGEAGWYAGPLLGLLIRVETDYVGNQGSGKRHSHSVEFSLYHDFGGDDETLITFTNENSGQCVDHLRTVVYDDYDVPSVINVDKSQNPITSEDFCMNVDLGSESITAVVQHSSEGVSASEEKILPVF